MIRMVLLGDTFYICIGKYCLLADNTAFEQPVVLTLSDDFDDKGHIVYYTPKLVILDQHCSKSWLRKA